MKQADNLLYEDEKGDEYYENERVVDSFAEIENRVVYKQGFTWMSYFFNLVEEYLSVG